MNIKVGKLYHIEIPQGSRLVFADIEYYSHDIFLIITKPRKIKHPSWYDQPDHFWYRMRAIVHDRIVKIEFKKHQAIYFKEININNQ